MPKTTVVDGTKPVPVANLKCGAEGCSGYLFQGPFLYGTVTEDGEFHADPKRTQYQCLACHRLQPLGFMQPRESLAAEL